MARAKWAEDLVAAWYVREGYDIVARNWRCTRGELDVVSWRDGVLVVCEVKARRN
ncbi:MAG: YraN family protein, partial [Actinobacteria bacterium]|nr:YraN family protein [Actinomycetota bacterium]